MRAKRFGLTKHFSLSSFILLLFVFIILSLVTLVFPPAFALTNEAQSNVETIVHEFLAIGLDDSGLAFQITPSSSGTFSSKSTNVHVYTNAKGYKLFVSADANNVNMNHMDSSITQKITPLDAVQSSLTATGIVSSAFPANSWGYSMNGTDYFGVRTAPTLIKETTGFTDIGDSITPIHFGVNINSFIPAGTYQSSVQITAIANVVLPSAPVISSPSGWVNSATIAPSVAGSSMFDVATYEFFVTDDATIIPDEDTIITGSGEELVISKDTGYTDGIYYVFFRTVDKSGKRSTWSNRVEIKLDITEPENNVATSTNPGVKTQTATLSCSDEKGLSAYYFGVSEHPADGDFTSIASGDPENPLLSWTDSKSISEAGTYHLFCKDTAGSISSVSSQTYYNYQVATLLNTIPGTKGNYIKANYEQKSITETYLAPKNMALNPADYYVVPTPESSVANYVGASTEYDVSNVATPATSGSFTVSSNNLTFYTWFNRNEYTLTLNREAGFSKVEGDGTYKHGAEVNISAELLDGYNWSHWEVISGDAPADLDQMETTITLTQNTELTAKNGDSQKPVLQSLTRTSHDTFSFRFTDNVGVTHYCINNSNTKPAANDACWTEANNETSYTGSKTVSTTGTYYVWAKDARDNINDLDDKNGIEAFEVVRDVDGATLTTKWDSATGSEFTDVNSIALDGTSVYYSAAANNADENYVIRLNGTLAYNGGDASTAPVTSAKTISVKDNLKDGKLTLYLHGGNPTAAAANLGSALFMQQVDKNTCANTTNSDANNPTTYKLVDARDGKGYLVKKIGNYCWMTQNLALAGNTTVSSRLSNVVAPFTLPPSSNSTNDYYSNKTAADTKSMYNGSHKNESVDIASLGEDGNLGAYYTFESATAGTGSNIATQYQNTVYSICPRGWRLPSFNNSDGATTVGGDFGALTGLTAWSSYNKDALTNSGFASFGNAYTSDCSSDGCPGSGSLGSYSYWWSSTVRSSTSAYRLRAYSSDGLRASNRNRAYGYQVRCVVNSDSTAPSQPQLAQAAYNQFTITSTDDAAVTGYYVGIDDTTAPTKNSAWTYVTPTANFSATYTATDMSAAHTYNVWTRDNAGNISARSSISTYPVNRTQGTGTTLVTKLDPTDNEGNGGIVMSTSGVAMQGTKVYASVALNNSETAAYSLDDFTVNGTNLYHVTDTNPTMYTTTTVAGETTMSSNAHLTTLGSKTQGVNDIKTMQQVNSIICSQTPANNDTVYFLIDDRINYTSNTKFSYRIKKLTDAYTDSNGRQQTGHCWMNQNLALQGDTTISKTMSNISSDTWKLPGSSNNANEYLPSQLANPKSLRW